jgi:hypothetical protein
MPICYVHPLFCSWAPTIYPSVSVCVPALDGARQVDSALLDELVLLGKHNRTSGPSFGLDGAHQVDCPARRVARVGAEGAAVDSERCNIGRKNGTARCSSIRGISAPNGVHTGMMPS